MIVKLSYETMLMILLQDNTCCRCSGKTLDLQSQGCKFDYHLLLKQNH